ncbi:MASE1 domain-containing protein [Actinopolymorpha singaporensis]|uniref:Integral membrane sensor domain MASE1 n=1 Tax=Actinopolymorpha singaporensis TaxID=117157 RepID=A0A1H1L3R3_9ACTN|nr:MASE1 domain-containing protein [Actinopolymorpha singaporensis]SDR69027.1 Integral membrane sensor domain MASE1 [Actinopolymorpha singaporensis]
MAKGQPSRRRHLWTVLAIIATGAAYLLAAQPGVLKRLGESGKATLVWPASGVALAALLIFRLRALPGVALGAFVATWVAFDRPLLVALGIAVEATVAALLAYALLRRAGFRNDLARLRDAVALVVCGAGAGMLTGAAIRSGVLVLAGIEPAREYGAVMLRGWLGSALGILVVTPFLLVLYRISLRRALPDVWRLVEAVGLLVCTLGVTWWVITGSTGGQELFLVFPLLIWAAWRFQLEGAAPCIVVVSVVTVYATVRGLGPFNGTDPQAALMTAQTFVAATTLATLFLAVAVTERNDARDEMDLAARELVRAVNILGERLRPDKTISADSGEAAPEPPDPRTRVRRERIQPPPDG